MRLSILFLTIVFITGCHTTHKLNTQAGDNSIRELRFINEYDLPNGMNFRNTTVGGLSGIDYDAARQVYYMNSDDPSSKGPTRYYTAKIAIGDKGIDSVSIINVTPLLNPAGQPFADITKDRIHSADVEAIRYDSKRDELVWSSEGQRVIRDGKQELEDPAIVIMALDGHFKDSFALPPNMHIQAEEKGPRHNSVFEGLSFDETKDHLFVSVEEPIYEDGPRAGLGDSTAWIRILKFNRKLKQCVAQYAYRVDAVRHAANPPNAFKINGVSDILYLGDDQFLVIERAWSTGTAPSDIRVYLADAKGASDISTASLRNEAPLKPIAKKLLLDMNTLGRFIDNIEGVTFGPVLPNGHRTLLFVADDNFASYQKSQFLLFEILP